MRTKRKIERAEGELMLAKKRSGKECRSKLLFKHSLEQSDSVAIGAPICGYWLNKICFSLQNARQKVRHFLGKLCLFYGFFSCIKFEGKDPSFPIFFEMT